MKPEVAFGSAGGENTSDEDARRQQDIVDEVCGHVVGSWLIWFPNR